MKAGGGSLLFPSQSAARTLTACVLPTSWAVDAGTPGQSVTFVWETKRQRPKLSAHWCDSEVPQRQDDHRIDKHGKRLLSPSLCVCVCVCVCVLKHSGSSVMAAVLCALCGKWIYKCVHSVWWWSKICWWLNFPLRHVCWVDLNINRGSNRKLDVCFRSESCLSPWTRMNSSRKTSAGICDDADSWVFISCIDNVKLFLCCSDGCQQQTRG